MSANVVKGKWFVVILFLVCFLPLSLAWGMVYFKWQPASSMANGEVLPTPIPLKNILYDPISSSPSTTWHLLVIQNQCDAICDTQLEAYRKMHVALGREAEKLSRVLVSVNKTSVDDSFLSLMPYSNLVKEQAQAMNNAVWLVDPMGWVVLKYSPDQPAAELHKDILRLLKSTNQNS